ncbi:MAG: DUF5074 domain-containing protein [Muribaculum sp.]|nr:DUF5074 domain-containing protein [Muribaculaceae bacterium]MCM1081359.1 DUF5074 domain-containing protein [Muribaculum sp.]
MKQLKLILGALIMLVTSSVAYAVSPDAGKVLNRLGEGSNNAIIVATWGDELALDNLVSEVKFDGTKTVGELINVALEADPRFYALQNAAGETVAYGFDTNGDNSAAVNFDGNKLSVVAGVAKSDAGDLTSATGSSEYDHWKVNTSDNQWAIFVNGKKSVNTESVKNGDVVMLQYLDVAASEPVENSYVFYLRPATEQGVWMQEECVVNTENGKNAYFPMIANVLGDVSYLYGAGISTEVYDIDGETTSNAVSAYVQNGTKGAMSCRVNISKPAPALVRPFLNIRKDWGDGKQTVKRVYGGVDSKVTTIVAHPMTDIRLEGYNPGDVIEIENMGVNILKPVYVPENADFVGYTPEFGNTDIATFYASVNAVVAHSAGETTLTVKDLQGNAYGQYRIRVKDVDPQNKPDDDFQDGLVFLNEEWFTHTSGSLNYIDATGKIYYRAYGNQNNNMAFGATSQFGITYGGKYIIMSKQPWDGGDTRPVKSGGRVVVFDAKTFKHIGAIDNIGGDGRACVGVNPSKVYLSTTTGIRVMDLDNITVADADIEGIEVKRNSGQVGNMIKAGKYVFAANIGTGLEIVDTETDKLVKSIASAKIQTVVQGYDGRVWIGCSNTLTPIDPTTLELGQEYTIPGSIGCSSSSWRGGNLMASTKANVLLWGKTSYNGNDGDLYRWNINDVDDPSTLQPIFVRDSEFNKAYGYGYGSPAYDDRTDTYIFATTAGFGASALKNWYHFINATTGEVKQTMALSSYWWFPAMPIVPDKYAAEIAIDNTITLDINDEPVDFDLSKLVTDADNLDRNITVSLDNAASDGDVAEVTLEGSVLTVAPVAVGTCYFTLNAESNGRVTSKEIKIEVDKTSGISKITDNDVKQYEVYNVSGIHIGSFVGKVGDMKSKLSVAPGVYLLKAKGAKAVKAVIK